MDYFPLLGLPLVVFRLITDLLDRHDIETFRLVSMACRYVSEPILFNVLTLHDITPKAENINKNICERLQSPNDNLSKCVRHLKIGPFKQEKNAPSAQILRQVLLTFQSLQDFSWNSCFPIPKEVLSIFHARWPLARLHVCNTNRSERFIPLDATLISSPQLHSLHLAVLVHRTSNTSEFPALCSALISAKSLRILQIEILDHTEHHSTFSTGPSSLPFTEGDVFPSLTELSLPCHTYTLTPSYCQAWLKVMDWSKLRTLDLNGGAPRYFLAALTGHVQHLKVLKFGLKPITPQMKHELWTCPDPGIVTAFLRSIEGLEELHVQTDSGSDFDGIKDAVYSSHGEVLRTLKVQQRIGYTRSWTAENVQHLSESCMNLRVIGFPVAITKDTNVEHPFSPGTITAELGQFLHLEEIDLVLKVSEYSSLTFLDRGRCYINESAAERYVTALLAFPYGRYKSLNSVRIKFVTLFQVYTLTLRQGQKLEKESSWITSGLFGLNPEGGFFDPKGLY